MVWYPVAVVLQQPRHHHHGTAPHADIPQPAPPIPTHCLAQQPAAPQHRANRGRLLPAVSRPHALSLCAETLRRGPTPIASGFVDVIPAPAFPLPPQPTPPTQPPSRSISTTTGAVLAVARPRSYTAASVPVPSAILAVRQAQLAAREEPELPVPCQRSLPATRPRLASPHHPSDCATTARLIPIPIPTLSPSRTDYELEAPRRLRFSRLAVGTGLLS